MKLKDLSPTSRAILERRIRKEVDETPWNISYACQLACDYLYVKRGDLITEKQAIGVYYSSVRNRTQLETIAQSAGVHKTKNIRRSDLNKSGTISKRSIHFQNLKNGKDV